jgi:dihydrofolate reductase
VKQNQLPGNPSTNNNVESSRPILRGFIAMSLDGFIAKPDGDVDWLSAWQGTPEQPPQPSSLTPDAPRDYGYEEFSAGIDTVLMGRKTWEKVLSFGFWPFAGKKVVVLTHRSLGQAAVNAEVAASGTPQEILDTLQRLGARNVYVDGGETLRLLLGHLTSLTLTLIPTLLGQGISLFGGVHQETLKIERVRSWTNGVQQFELRLGASGS